MMDIQSDELNSVDHQLMWQVHPNFETMMGTLDDLALLRLIKHGDKSAVDLVWTEIYRRYHRDVWHYLKSKVCSILDVNDLSGEVWLTALIKLSRFRISDDGAKTRTPIKTWLLTTARYKTLEFFRQQRHRVDLLALVDLENTTTPLTSSASTATSSDEQIGTRHVADQKLASLTPTFREIVRLIYFEEKNSTEIAEMLGLKSATVRKAHQRALAQLRQAPLDTSEFPRSTTSAYNDHPRFLK